MVQLLKDAFFFHRKTLPSSGCLRCRKGFAWSTVFYTFVRFPQDELFSRKNYPPPCRSVFFSVCSGEEAGKTNMYGYRTDSDELRWARKPSPPHPHAPRCRRIQSQRSARASHTAVCHDARPEGCAPRRRCMSTRVPSRGGAGFCGRGVRAMWSR